MEIGWKFGGPRVQRPLVQSSQEIVKMAGKLVKMKKFLGVYFRESQERPKYLNERDRCFYYTYKRDSRQVTEKAGWASEGYSAQMAANLRADTLRNIRHGEDIPLEKRKIPLFSNMAELFLEWAKENKKDQNDAGRYENYLKKPLGEKRLHEVSTADLEAIQTTMRKKGLSPATIRHAMTLVRSIYSRAILLGKFKGISPTKMIKFPTVNNRRERFLTHEEAQRLLDELKKGSQTIYETALVSLLTGLRAAEIHNLKGRDVDCANGLIHVSDPKNKSSRKAIMPKEVVDVLKKRIADPNEFVFSPRIHELPHIKRVSSFFQRTVDRLFNQGVEDRRQRVVFHTLRHTFASWLAIQGTPLLTIKELLGHKTLAMTERYSHLSPDSRKDVVSALQNNFDLHRNGKVISITEARKKEESA